MAEPGKILDINTRYVVPGGEIEILCEDFRPDRGGMSGCKVDSEVARVSAASSKRVFANVPTTEREKSAAKVQLFVGEGIEEIYGGSFTIDIGEVVAEDMHIVANPAIDPSDDALVVTRSGSRGQRLENTIYRVETGGYVDELPDPVLNPTAIAFGTDGQMYVTNRADGEVWAVNANGNNSIHASGLGIATGLAFGPDGAMYVGDRSGIIYRIDDFATPQVFATLEPSVAAYHIAFGVDGRLYVSAPGLASSDGIYAIDPTGNVTTFFRGLGRPQGMAFDTEGNLYIAACRLGRHGVVRISPDAKTAELFVSGNSVVGLCFNREGDMLVATNDTVYSLPVGIQGTLLK
jgi:sugar lactone lactonase YvrE